MINDIRRRLTDAGMSNTESAAKQLLFEQSTRLLRDLCGTPDDRLRAFFVPGRIEVLGKHTDYAGGRSILCTVERGLCVAATGREDTRVRVLDAGSGSQAEAVLEPHQSASEQGFANYVATVARRIALNFPSARRGADIVISSDLPRAAGMSSSSALVIAIFLVLAEINSLAETEAYRNDIPDLESLAGYLGCVENGQNHNSLTGDRGVGTFGGSEDHTAILCCRAGELSVYSFCPVRHERTISFPAQYSIVVATSGVVAEKTGSARDRYNSASLAVTRILEVWCASTGRSDCSLAAALHACGPELIRETLRSLPGSEGAALISRFEQFWQESGVIIPAASDALAQGDVESFGSLVDRSQEGAERLLGNQVPETISLCRSARTLGATAASAFGAGFGGSVWALVPDSGCREFVMSWAECYRRDFPDAGGRASFFITRPGPPAMCLLSSSRVVVTTENP